MSLVGGGKTVDTGKAVAYRLNAPCIVVPTLASNDAPCSALSIIYKTNGEFEQVFYFPLNPSVVLVDTEIVAFAPVRYLISGMGDAMSTRYEAEVCFKNPKARNCVGGRPTVSAIALARLCAEMLYEYGVQAVEDCKNNQVTEALERVVEANTLLSGLGFESAGLAAAHGIQNGFSIHEKVHSFLHGEKVAFCTVVQLIIEENRPETEKVINFFLDVGLPVHLGFFGVEDAESDRENLFLVAQKALDDTIIHNMPMELNPELIVNAIIEADILGRAIESKRKKK